MKEELYKWYPIVGEGEYWLNADANPLDDTPIRTIVTNGRFLWTYEDKQNQNLYLSLIFFHIFLPCFFFSYKIIIK